MIPNTDYENFFTQAFGREKPFYYQQQLAINATLPDLLNAPTGAGKTAGVLGAWLYRRLHNPASVGRRLVYCLPMRTLVEQTARVARQAIENLNLQERFSVHTLLGGDVNDDFESRPEKESIIIGTQDMLLSRALNRGYAMSRYKWAVHFGLLNNDCWWVFDEVQLFGDGLATTAQLAAFRERFGTFGGCQSLWMSATLERDWLETVDFTKRVGELNSLELTEDDTQSAVLARRLNAVKVLQKADASCREAKGLAEFVKAEHETGTQTLIVVNTVKRAQEVCRELEKAFGLNQKPKPSRGKQQPSDSSTETPPTVAPEICLLHSRFRPLERAKWQAIFDDKTANRIIVATQVVEAGVDISSKLLVTDVAPFSSLVQRFGRCNREGEHERAAIFWIETDEKNYKPYETAEVRAAIRQLAKLESVAPDDLQKFKDGDAFEPQKYEPTHVLRRRDLIDLFDTTADLSGFDLDISRFVRGGDERDVSLFWRDIEFDKRKKYNPTPLKKTPKPLREELCSAPLGKELTDFLKKKKESAWTWDALGGEWQKVDADRLRPGMMIMLASEAGGYDEKFGWNPAASEKVRTAKETSEKLAAEIRKNGAEEANDDEPLSVVNYKQTLSAHSLEVRDKAVEILNDLNLPALESFRDELVFVAHHHDLGKAHPVFQATLHNIPKETKLAGINFDLLLAKSKSGGKHRRKKFRHELASALALLQMRPERSNLEIYLAACHHGKVRLSIRALPDEKKPENDDGDLLPNVKFARGVWDGDRLLAADLGDGLVIPPATLDLEPMLLGGGADGKKSWLERMIELRDRADLGVFRLAFLESLIRAADVRASAKPISTLPDTETNQNA